MNEYEKHIIKMQHKLHRLKVIVERFENAVIDENVYKMANELNDMKNEIENTYDGMDALVLNEVSK